jgi:hypothetical protein
MDNQSEKVSKLNLWHGDRTKDSLSIHQWINIVEAEKGKTCISYTKYIESEKIIFNTSKC